MSVTSIIAENYSVFHKSLLFFIRLAWRSRITLPYLILIGFMVLDIRLTLEIVIDVDVEHHTPDGIGSNQGENDIDSEQELENNELG